LDTLKPDRERLMKIKYVVPFVLLSLLVLGSSVAHAQKSLSSGYRITTDHHGTDVIIGESVTAWADTTDLTTGEVVFEWKWGGSETPKRIEPVTGYITWYTGVGGWPEEPGVPHGTEVRRFTDSYTPDELGEWAVKAQFINNFGQTSSSDNDSFPVRATSFNVIPEATFGTIAILTAMFGALGFFAIKKKHIVPIKMPL